MAEITASLVKDLREKTGAGMMDCKRALNETQGDLEAAIDWLRKKGLAAAAKKASRVAAEGAVAIATSGTRGVLVELNSETDFVARNDGFQAVARAIAQVALDGNGDTDSLREMKLETGETVTEAVTRLVATIGENITLRRSAMVSVGQGAVVPYIHNRIEEGLGKIGVIVALDSSLPAESLQDLGKQIAMHVAAQAPAALSIETLPPEMVERERVVQIGLAKEDPKNAGKPDDILEKMISGRMRKFYEDRTLLEQPFIMGDGKQKVREMLEEKSKALGAPIAITGYARFQTGEGIEKAADDFAEEVRKLST